MKNNTDISDFISSLHPLLQRQVERFIMPHCGPADIDKVKNFMIAVSDAYESNEKEKRISDRMFDVSAQEYQEINQKLQNEKEVIELSIQHLIEAVKQFTENQSSLENKSLIEIAEFVKERAFHQKEIEKEINQKRREAIQANNAKSDFLSTMSHEMRTPLNVIVAITHILMQEDYLPEQEENLEILKINAENLKYLINDILDFSKIEAGKIDLETHPFSIKKMVERLGKAQMPAAKNQNINLILDVDPNLPKIVIGDANRIGQCITNLLSNAIKFSKNGEVKLICKKIENKNQDPKIYFEVSDTGIGIDKDKQEHIFEPFFQMKQKVTTTSGTGLGLPISKRILNLMDSNIQVESSPGQGSRFFFDIELPIVDVSERKGQEEHVDNKTDLPQNLSILLVEDYPFNVMVIQKLLQPYNAQITIAKDGKEAIEQAKQRESDFDLILMDLYMPELNGIETTKQLRKMGITSPIIAISASTTKETVQSVKDVGMNGFLAKPFDPNSFTYHLSQFLEQQ